MTPNEHGHFIGYDYRHWGQLYAQERRGELWIWAPLYPQTQHNCGPAAGRSTFKVASIADAETLAANFEDAGFVRDYVAGIIAVQQAFDHVPQTVREAMTRDFNRYTYTCDADAVQRLESMRKSVVAIKWAPPPPSKVLAFERDMAALAARADKYERTLEKTRRLKKTAS